MDIFLVILGFALMLVGIIGSFLPILPGPPISWLGILVLHLTSVVPKDYWILGSTLAVALVIWVLDYIIPIIGAKKFGGTKAGMIGTAVGLVLGIIIPIPGGIIIGPFVGALVGELTTKVDQKTALKAAFGSFLGFLTGTFLKFVVSILFLVLYISITWDYKEELFTFIN